MKIPIGGRMYRRSRIIWNEMNKKVLNGVYVVVDPSLGEAKIIRQLKRIQEEKIAAVQIWDNPRVDRIEPMLIEQIIEIFLETSVPVLINNHWEFLESHALDGVHFDTLPADWEGIQKRLSRPFIKGLTLQNDLTSVRLFNELNFDYLSFCSLFPSATAEQCEIVSMDTIKKCRKLTLKPIFLAGGIHINNIHSVRHLPANGVAVVSAIMDAEDPTERLREFNHVLNIAR